jgi:multiple sugar transport system permease protein
MAITSQTSERGVVRPVRTAPRRRLNLNSDRLAAIGFGLPAAVLLAIVVVYPLINDVRLSLQHISPGVDEPFVGLRNYKAVFADGAFWHSVWVTLRYTVISLVVEFVLGLGLALLMTKIVRGGGALRTLILIPTMLTPSVAAINFRNLLNYDFGLVNYFIGLFGGTPRPWLADSGFSLAALVATDVWRSTPFFVLVLSAGLLSLSPEVMEASELDGASGWRKLISVQIPMLIPLILVTVLFRVIDLFRTFDTVFTLTSGGPGNATNVTSMQIYTDMYVGQYTSYAATEAVVFLLLTLVISVLVVRLMRAQRR